MVPLSSYGISRVPHYSGYNCAPSNFTYGAITLCDLPSQTVRLSFSVAYVVQNPGCIATSGLACSGFARRYSRNRVCFLFLRLLRCFSSAGSPPATMYSLQDCTAFPVQCFHIRTSPDQCIFAAPRSLSQLVASFFASWCQGIPLMLFLA